MIVLNVPQGSPEWHDAKLGVPSSSLFKKIFTSTGLASSSAGQYMNELLGERMTGEPHNRKVTADMKRGNIFEPEARNTFSFIYDFEVREVGCCYPDGSDNVSIATEMKERPPFLCSPDGFLFNVANYPMVGYEGLEIKCPNAATHIRTLRKGVLPTDHKHQVQGSLFVTGFSHWWFMSYHPGLQPFIIRVGRDESFIKKLEVKLTRFCDKLNKETERLKGGSANGI